MLYHFNNMPFKLAVLHIAGYTVLLLASVLLTLPARAADSILQQEAQQKTQQHLQNIEEQRQLDQRKEQQKRIERLKPKSKQKIDNTIPIPTTIPTTAHCFKLKNVQLTNHQLITTNDVASAIKPYIGQCIAKALLIKIQGTLNKIYLEQGYTTSRVFLVVGHNIKSGTVRFSAAEGKVAAIIVNTNNEDDQKLATVFDVQSEQYFYLPDFEKAIDNINRLESTKAKLKIEPADKQGYSNIKVAHTSKDNVRITFKADDNGDENTSKIRNTLSIKWENLTKKADMLYLSVTKGKNEESDTYSRSVSLSYESILGGIKTYSSLTHTKYSIPLGGAVDVFAVTTGNATNYQFEASNLFYRTKKLKLKLAPFFSIYGSHSYINDTLIDTSSFEHETVGLRSTNVAYFLKGNASLGITYEAGRQRDELPEQLTSESESFQLAKWNMRIAHPLFYNQLQYAIALNSQRVYSKIKSIKKQSFAARGIPNANVTTNGRKISHSLNLDMSKYFFKVSLFYEQGIGKDFDGNKVHETTGSGYELTLLYKKLFACSYTADQGRKYKHLTIKDKSTLKSTNWSCQASYAF